MINMEMFFKLLILIMFINSVEFAAAEEPSLFEKVVHSKSSDPKKVQEISRTHVNKKQLTAVQQASAKLKRDEAALNARMGTGKEKIEADPLESKNLTPVAKKNAPLSAPARPSKSEASGPHSTQANPGELPEEMVFPGQ